MSIYSIIIQIFSNGLMLGVQYALIAVGFTLFFGVLDVINFSHGDVFMLGAFIAVILINILGSLMGTGGISYLVILLVLFLGCMLITGVLIL